MYKEYRLDTLKRNLILMGASPLDVMITGVTGAGKSTTLNSIFQKNTATVGRGVDPETMSLESYTLNNLIHFWDTPGLGDGVVQDTKHAKNITRFLYKTYIQEGNEYGFIDMVLVIIDGSNRDMGTTYKLLNEVIIPNFQKKRIIVAINQADMAMKGREWDYKSNSPLPKLKTFLDNKSLSIQKRVKEATGVSIVKPIYYSAECDYNINVLLDAMIGNMPETKRLLKLTGEE